MRKTRRIQFLTIAMVVVLTLATSVSASFSFTADDNSGYYDARAATSIPLCYYDEEFDEDDGWFEIKGDHNAPYGPDTVKLEVRMRFQASEACTEFKVGAAWSLSWMVETNWPVGYASIHVKYILYNDGNTALETQNTACLKTANTPLWGSYDSDAGIYSLTTDDYEEFTYHLQNNAWYRVAIQLTIYLDGEANVWSQSGSGNPINLDVSEIVVYG